MHALFYEKVITTQRIIANTKLQIHKIMKYNSL